MPEISQDAFEVANPGVPTVTAQELRVRANSGSGVRPQLAALTSASSPALLQPTTPTTPAGAGQKIQTAGHEYLYGYKRESSHR